MLLNTAAANRVSDRLLSRADTLHAPHLLDLEVVQVLRRYARAGDLNERRGEEALEDLANLSIRRYSHEMFLVRIWRLRNNMSAYDAAYVALAETLDAPLVTRDARLAAARGHSARIEVL